MRLNVSPQGKIRHSPPVEQIRPPLADSSNAVHSFAIQSQEKPAPKKAKPVKPKPSTSVQQSSREQVMVEPRVEPAQLVEPAAERGADNNGDSESDSEDGVDKENIYQARV